MCFRRHYIDRGKLFVVLIVTLLLSFSPACKRETGTPKNKLVANGENGAKLVIYTTFHPTTYFTRAIGGERCEVVCPLPADEDPADWMPTASQVASYQDADLIVANGANFEKWLAKVSLPESKLVDTAKPFAEKFIELEQALTHSHGPGSEHTHAGIDGHTWLDPTLAKVQAVTIRDALIEADPDGADVYQAGFKALEAELDRLDERLRQLAPRMKGVKLLASHPAYNYLAREYGWDVKNFHLDPGTMPDTHMLEEVKLYVSNDPSIKYMLWESTPADEVEALFRSQLGLEPILFRPAEAINEEQKTADENYVTIMSSNLDELERIFGQ